ncbi:hypothetical protein HHL28_04505 [Aerophototrophica crusticola]|uniref:Uncharacterized protein n=1 Tax=Aerophototrophica crusticola TaxID=1709002 RepID=A0A858R5W1_9PROT|nr:hypothetical protein HHL28_04505 [Rhodospirillaceae bacterium B3]
MSRLFSPFVATFDASGLPRDGAKLYTYEAGTSTPKPTYSDPAMTTPHANPVVADSAGLFPAIFGAGAYKVVLRDKADNLVQSIDGLEFPAGDSFTQGGTGSVPVQLADAIRQYVTPARFGATPGGVVDSTTAMRDWLAYVQANPVAGFIDAVYRVTDELQITVPGTKIFGCGLKSGIYLHASNKAALRVATSRCVVHDIKLTSDLSQFSGNTGLRLAPVNESAGFSEINDNNIRVYVNGFENGIVLRPGPRAGALDSQLYYNHIAGEVKDCRRGVWLAGNASPGSGSGSNRNWFRLHIWGPTYGNTGFQLDDGEGNFLDNRYEQIQNHTGPNATPTALKILNVGSSSGIVNDANYVVGEWEACTRDVENHNASTVFAKVPGMVWSRVSGTAPYGGLTNRVQSSFPSEIPDITPSTLYQANSQVTDPDQGLPFEDLVMHVTAPRGLSALVGRFGRQEVARPSGGSSTHAFPGMRYKELRVYLVTRGAYTASGTAYLVRCSIFLETGIGTLVELPRLADNGGGSGLSWMTDALTRTDSQTLQVTVNIATGGAATTNFASVLRLA